MRFTTHIGFTKRIHKEHKPLSRNLQYILLSLAPGYFLLWGLLLQPFPEMVRGLMRIFVEPDFLITDYAVSYTHLDVYKRQVYIHRFFPNKSKLHIKIT